MTSIGDTPFDPEEYMFTVAEAAKVSGVAEADLRNWMRREVVPVGKKNRLARIMFSAADVVRLRVIGDLNRLLGVEPSKADPIAGFVANHCIEWMQRGNTHLHQTKDGYRRETRLLLTMGQDCETPSLGAYEWGEQAFSVKVAERGEENAWTRRPFMVLPVEQIFQDVLEELFAILESEADD